MNQQEFQEKNEPTANGALNDTNAPQPEEMNTDENLAGIYNLSEAIANEDEMGKLQTEIAEQKDKYLRLFAEFDNYKRRNARERIEMLQTAGKEVVVSLLEVLDDCDRAEKVITKSDDIEVVKEGVQLVFNKLRNTLQARGLKPMETINTPFNADIHEAITEIPAPNEEMQGKVMDEVTKGYYLNEKIIRFAKVVVGK